MPTFGLLQCDEVAEELQAEFGSYPTMFQRLFTQVSAKIIIKPYDVRAGDYPRDLTECDGYLTSGSQHGINDPLPWVDRFLDFLRELHHTQTNYFGICFGHQALARALGGTVQCAPQGWGLGITSHPVITPKPWMRPPLDQLNLCASHQDQVTELPKSAELLAGSQSCPHYLFQVGPHMAGVQGHPEFPTAYAAALMRRRQDLIPADQITQGLASLQTSTEADALPMAQWITRFLTTS